MKAPIPPCRWTTARRRKCWRDFEAGYRQQFSFLMPGRALVVEALSVEATSPGESIDEAQPQPQRLDAWPRVARTVRMYSGGACHDTPVYRREALRPGDAIPGPAIIADANATTVVEPQWQAHVTPLNHLVLTRMSARPQRAAIGTRADPVMLEIFNNLFMAIAEQMGVTLANTAYSVNIKERLDFSCALFDAAGDFIANAPHLPVHLGAMGESVRAVASDERGQNAPGRRLRAERSLSRRHAPARRDGGDAGLPAIVERDDQRNPGPPAPDPGSRTPHPVLRRLPRPPRRYRRHHARIDAARQRAPRRGRRADHQLQAGRSRRVPRARDAGAPGRRALPCPQRRAEPRRSAGDGRRQPEGRRRARAHGRSFRAGRGAGLHAARAGQRRGIGAARDRRPEGRRVRLRDGQRRSDTRENQHRPRGAQRRDRFHRHLAAAPRQLQRAGGGHDVGRSLRLPHAGRRRTFRSTPAA